MCLKCCGITVWIPVYVYAKRLVWMDLFWLGFNAERRKSTHQNKVKITIFCQHFVL